MDFVLDRCESCEGIWLNKDQLKGILRKAARGPLGAFLDRCFAKDEPGKKRSISR
jgi:Zn-finger nucleic acid-binding protein